MYPGAGIGDCADMHCGQTHLIWKFQTPNNTMPMVSGVGCQMSEEWLLATGCWLLAAGRPRDKQPVTNGKRPAASSQQPVTRNL